MNITNLVPVALGTTNVDITGVEEFAYSLDVTSNAQDDLSSYGGNNYMSQRMDVLDSLPELKKSIEENINQYCEEVYKFPDNVEIYITQSWVTITPAGTLHHQHTHPNSFISGVMYITGEGDSDKIEFDSCKHPILMPRYREYTAWNSTTWWMPANPGTLYLFPSNLHHRVPPTKSSGTRISLAFNTFLRGELGEHKAANHLFL
jgi:uncharacterized protein (TIGR02466 family)